MNTRRRFLAAALLAPLPLLLRTPPASASCGAELPSDADVGFCRDMSIHHAQALVMCQRVLGRDTGDFVQAAAAEVLQNQAMEVGQMRAWLADWGESTVPPTIVMGWMGANGGLGIPVGDMPGYASSDEILELSTLSGWTRGRRWLELMRAHHVGGVMMATRATELAVCSKVARLAELQAAAQTYEISQYDVLLEGPYADV